MLRLHRTIGNQATRQLLDARDAPVQRCGGEVHAGCSCADGSSATEEDSGGPQVQRAAEVSTAGAERAAGERPPLASPRFAGDALLEACHQDKARLGVGARGESVRKVQQALIDLGSGLGAAGADGVYGPATAAAVRQFKAKVEARVRAVR